MISCKMPGCGHRAHYLVPHLMEAHGLHEEDYSGDVTSPELMAAFDARKPSSPRKPPDLSKGLVVKFAGVEMPVNTEVPSGACAPLPQGYSVPQHGKLAESVRRVAVRYAHGNSKPIWVWGPPGTGKDAVFAALSAATRRPCITFNIAPDMDIQAWLAVRAFSPNGTFWEEGPLLRALRDGYILPSGKRVPYMVVLSDLDRASRSQMEPLRAILDSLGGKIQAPNGVHQVLPGTLVVATANTSGGGDFTGRYTSSSVDLSILDRFTFKVMFYHLDPRDEESLVRAKYPTLCARFPDLAGIVMRCVTAIRDAIEKEEIFLDFGHRAVCNWLDAANAEAHYSPRTRDAANILRSGLQDILAGAPNADTREAVKRLCDPHLKCGVAVE